MTPYLSRRNFLGSTALVGAGLAASSVFGAPSLAGVKKVKVGLIGCGGRGNGALKNFHQACAILGIEAEVTGVGDWFKDKADRAGKTFGLGADKCFGGADNYQKVIASGCDFVLMATPPSFRPLHFAAAVEAGKHCFIEKPVAVDPVGARAVMATAEKARAKGLGVVGGTQRRHMAGYLKNKALIDAGAIGEIRGGVVTWNGRVPWVKSRKDGMSNADYLAMNWLNFTELSGDHIVEQHIHNLDVAVWFLGRLPKSAVGMGGRARRISGNQYDFFSVDYNFGEAEGGAAGDVHILSQCRQMAGTHSAVGETFTGSKGVCMGGGKLKGVGGVKVPAIKLDTDNGQVQEHVDLIRSVLTDQPLNDAKEVAESTMVAIMGRISAYTGEMVRWTDLTKNEDSDFYHLALSPAAVDFENGPVTMPAEEAAVPGEAGGIRIK
ncbi:MAG: Gfo/Idh/MocA family protein [Verrucomicrobiota bacterium JB025]|nr:Gfo/Idh/MocA family oxidoreductase [Verrucomicrobiota bacterium JB025]